MNVTLTPSTPDVTLMEPVDRRAMSRIYSREAFLALLDRQSETTVREALEDNNIPNCHRQDALDWLEARTNDIQEHSL
jgi:hypothetical protein